MPPKIGGLTLAAGMALYMSAMASGREQPDQHALAKRLLQSDEAERAAAISEIRDLPRDALTPALRDALVASLDSRTRTIQQIRGRGQAMSDVLHPEVHARICETVAELKDPATIPVLARALGTCGFVIHRVVAAFGERAVPHVVSVVTARDSHYDAVNEGLIALRMIVENARPGELPEATLSSIKRAAAQHLEARGRPYGTGVTLRKAIDLAGVLQDKELTLILRSIASNPATIIAKGVTDPQLVEKTRKQAADRLNGVPPLPRP